MADGVKTTHWGFPTRLTDVATNTTLGTSTRYEFATKNIKTPESGRTLRSAFVRVTFVGSNTSAIDVDGIRIGSNVEAAGWVDVDTTTTVIDSGETETTVILADITSNVNSNWGSGADFDLQIAVVCAHESASNIRGITCRLYLTYAFDATSATQQKSMILPIQAHLSDLDTSYIEVGVSGTGGAPASQIPDIDALLPENTCVVDEEFMHVYGLTVGTPATTDCTMSVRFNGGADNARFVCEEALQSSFRYEDILDSSMMPATSAAATFEAKSDVQDRFYGIGAELIVTWHFTLSSTTSIMNSVCVPFDYGAENLRAWTSAQGLHRLTTNLYINEPGSITMGQCGVVIMTTPWQTGAGSMQMGAPSQTTRTYTGSASHTGDSYMPFVQRTDHSSSNWALSRGRNTLHFDIFTSAENARAYSGYAIINYTSGVPTAGIQASNQTTYWFSKALAGIANNSFSWTPVEPVIPGAEYVLSGVAVMLASRDGTTSPLAFHTERLAGEDSGAGWYLNSIQTMQSAIAAEVCDIPRILDLTPHFKKNTYVTTKVGANIETEREYRIACVANIDVQAYMFITHHEVTNEIVGNVMMDGVALASDSVNVFEFANGDGGDDADQYPACLVGAAETDGSGDWTFNVLDSNKKYFVRAHNGSFAACSDELNPGGADLDIDVYSTAGGAEKFHGSSFNRGFN